MSLAAFQSMKIELVDFVSRKFSRLNCTDFGHFGRIFAFEASLWGFHRFTTIVFLHTFYPSNSQLLCSVSFMKFHRFAHSFTV